MSDGVRWNLGTLRIWRKWNIGGRLGKPFGVMFAVNIVGLIFLLIMSLPVIGIMHYAR